VTRRERNQWLAAGLAVFALSVLIGLDAAGIDVCVWQFFNAA